MNEHARCTAVLFTSAENSDTGVEIHGETHLPFNASDNSVTAPGSAAGSAASRAVSLRVLDAASGAVAAILVPPLSGNQVSCNGVTVSAGLHLLRHGDRLDVNGVSHWVAAHSTVRRVAYDPQLHGEESFCTVTKSRLHAGAPIAICPGPPGVDCGSIYSERAWNALMEADPNRKCSVCGYHTGLASWSPSPAKQRKSFDELLPKSPRKIAS